MSNKKIDGSLIFGIKNVASGGFTAACGAVRITWVFIKFVGIALVSLCTLGIGLILYKKVKATN